MSLIFLLLGLTVVLAVPVPLANVDLPDSIKAGASVTPVITFDNVGATSSDVGFGPFLDVVTSDLIASIDGPASWNGLELVSSEPHVFQTDGECIQHPYLFADIGGPPDPIGPNTPGYICGDAGQSFTSILLPFSSYGPDATAVPVDLPMTTSTNTGDGFVYANPGFLYGETVTINSLTDPPIIGGMGTQNPADWPGFDQIRSAAVVAEISNTWANPTGWGHDNAFNYTIDLDVADGTTITDSTVTVDLPEEVGFGGLYVTDPATGEFILICMPPAELDLPMGCVNWMTLTFITGVSSPPPCYEESGCDGGPGFTGGGQVTITFAEYSDPVSVYVEGVPMGYDAMGDPFADPNDPNPSTNTATVTVDGTANSGGGGGGGGGGAVNVGGTSSTVRTSLNLGKSAGAVVGGGDYVPGAVVLYIMTIEIAQEFTFDSMVLTDQVRDGQRWDPTRPVTFTVGGVAADMAGHVSSDLSDVGNDCCNDGTSGTQLLTFRAVDAWTQANGGMQTPIPGPETATITYYTVVQQEYTDRTVDNTPTGAKTVFGGDCLDNNVQLESDLVENFVPFSLLGTEQRTSNEQVTVPQGNFDSSLYAVDGVLCSVQPAVCANPEFAPGALVTMRVTNTMKHQDFYQLRVSQSLPIPLFEVTNLSWNVIATDVVDASAGGNRCTGSSVPALDRMCFLDSSHTVTNDPTFFRNTASNFWELNFGDNSDPGQTPGAVDVLLTVALTGIPWIDGFDIVTLEDRQEHPSGGCTSLPQGRNIYRVKTPRICMAQSIVAQRELPSSPSQSLGGDSGNFNFDMTSVPPFPATISQQALNRGTDPVGAVSASDVAAGTRLRMATQLSNFGKGTAYDVLVSIAHSDPTLSQPLNVACYTGARATVPCTFSAGVVSIDRIEPATERKGQDPTGNNVVFIVYDVDVQNSFVPGVSTTNIPAQLTQYRAIDNTGINYVTTLHTDGTYKKTCTDPLSVSLTGVEPTIAHSIVTGDPCTDDNDRVRDVAVGEEFAITTVLTLPRGTIEDSRLLLEYDGNYGFRVINSTITKMVATAETASLVQGYAYPGLPVESVDPSLIYDFQDLTTASTETDLDLEVETWWMPIDGLATMQHNRVINFDQDLTYTRKGGARTISTRQQIRLRVQYMNIVGSKNVTDSSPADEGDIIELCYTLTRRYNNMACAYDVELNVPIPMEYTLLSTTPSVEFNNGDAVSGVDTSATTSNNVNVQIDVIERNDRPVEVCFPVRFDTAMTGVAITTTGTVCADTAPLGAPPATETCRSSNIAVTPEATITMVGVTNDPCTDDARDVLRVGEEVTLTKTVTLPEGTTSNFRVDTTWSSAGRLAYVSSRIISVGSCITGANSVGTAGDSSVAGRVRWDMGTVQRSMMTGNCGQIVFEVIARLTPNAANDRGDTLDVVGTVSGGGSSKTATIQYTVAEPQLAATNTLIPDTGDAGDATQFCVSVTNDDSNPNTAACAYDTQINVPVPAGYSAASNPLVAAVGTIQPGDTEQRCFDLTLTDTALTADCNPISASVDYNSDNTANAATNGIANTNSGITNEFCIGNPTITMDVQATGDACTANGVMDNSVPGVQVGETVTYRQIITLPEGTTAVVSPTLTLVDQTFVSASIARVGSRLSGSIMGATPTQTNSPVRFEFGSVVNAADGANSIEDQIWIDYTVRTLPSATDGQRVVSPFTLVHPAGTIAPGTAQRPVVEIVAPVLLATGTATPAAGGAWGDEVTWSSTIQHNGGSGCAYNTEICETVTDSDYIPGSVMITGVTPMPTVTETADGFCFTIPDYPATTGIISVTYRSTLQDLTPGENRCADVSAEFTSAPANGFALRDTTDQRCVPQLILETIGDTVWIDENGNGLQDNVGQVGGETPIENAVVTLRRVSDMVVVTTVATNALGYYEFNRFEHGLAPNVAYDIEIDTRPGLQPTTTDAGDDTRDSDANLVGSIMSGTLVISGASVPPATDDFTYDFGFAQPLTIGDFVWEDLNQNGIQDDGAGSALANVIVVLRDAMGVEIARDTTDSNGAYSFSSLDIPQLQPNTDYQLTIALDSQMPLERTVGGRDTNLVPTSLGAGSASTDNNASPDVAGTTAVIDYTTPNRWSFDDPTLDFGLTTPPLLGFEIGNYVWLDENNNGLQDSGETPLDNVAVEIVDSMGVVVATTNTNPSGLYTFQSAGSGYTLDAISMYTLRLNAGQAALAGLLTTTPTQGMDTSVDSNGQLVMGTVTAAITTPIDGTDDLTFDFGFREILLEGVVWIDTDGDGQQDEMTLQPGYTVTLYAADGTTVIGQVVTDASGAYEFSSKDFPQIVPGQDYVVGVTTTPSGGGTPTYQPTVPGIGDPLTDSDGTLRPNRNDEIISTVTAPSTGSAERDYGLVPRFQLGNFVWLDTNGDGIQDSGELGIGDVDVELVDPTGTVLDTQTTDGTGFYLFDSLLPGVAIPQTTAGYTIRIAVAQSELDGLSLTAQDTASAQPNNDSDGELRMGFDVIDVTTPTYGTADLQHDFGFRRLSFGNRVFYDLDADGIQDTDGSEPGFSGVTVELRDAMGALIDTTTTGADGIYSFSSANADSVVPGAMLSVVIVLADNSPLDGLVLTPAGTSGSTEANDSDADERLMGAQAVVDLVVPAWGVDDVDIADFGFQPLLEIGDYVWRDMGAGAAAGNGLQDAGEVPVGANVQVVLTDGAAFTATTLTDATGFYKFDRRTHPQINELSTYSLFVPLNQPPLDGLQPTLDGSLAPGAPLNTTLDSNGVWDRTNQIALASITTPAFGTVDYTFDFGFVEQFGLGDQLFEDVNGNGIFEPGTDRPLPGVTVELYDGAGVLVGTTTTDMNGEYEFLSDETTLPMVPGAAYEVRVPLNQGAVLENEFGQLLPTTPNAPGSDDTNDSDAVADLSNGVAVITNAVAGDLGQVIDTYDFGFVGPLVIGDYVWLDANSNGVQDSGEMGVANVLVELVDAAGTVVDSQLTNSTGYYSFNQRTTTAMTPDTAYIVRIDRGAQNPGVLDTLQLTSTDMGANNAIDNDASINPMNSDFYDVDVASTGPLGNVDETYDFGLVQALFVQGTLWRDDDADGSQNEVATSPLAGRRVELLDSSGALIANTTTAADGSYSFNSVDVPELLPNQMYTINVPREQPLLDGLHETDANVPADNVDSDGTRSGDNVIFTATTGAYGSPPIDADFGFVRQVRLGNFVWRDTNEDGIQDPGEPGIAGVEVKLVGASGTLTQVTDANGFYEFESKNDGLEPSTLYEVQVDALQMSLMYTRFGVSKPLRPSPVDAGSDRTVDSNGVPTDLTPVNPLTQDARDTITSPMYGDEDMTIDFGWFEVPFDEILIGDFLWIDSNGDGVQQATERPLGGVTVHLRDATGTIVATDVTTPAGLYEFNQVEDPAFRPAEDYTITIDLNQPALNGLVPTVANSPTGTPGTDSNGTPNAGNTRVEYAFTSQPEGPDVTIDFGFQEVFIGDYVWHDENHDGLQDPGEEVLSNVLVELRLPNGQLVASSLTDSEGKWLFTSYDDGLLPNQQYELRYPIVGALADFEPTERGVGLNNTINSKTVLDASRTFATQTLTTPPYGSSDITLDAGFVQQFTIGNRFWLDLNGDGEQTVGETDISGVTMTIVSDSDRSTVLGSTTTDSNGLYEFRSLRDQLLPNSSYVILIDGEQASLNAYRQTIANQGTDLTDSGVVRVSDTPLRYELPVETPTFGVNDPSFDAGFVQPFGLGDFVFHDVNANGVQDAGDLPLAGVVVELYADANRTVLLATDTTDANGEYYFNSWESGLTVDTTYTIAMDLSVGGLQGFQPTDPRVGGNGTLDSSGELETPGGNIVRDDAVQSARWNSEERQFDYGFVERLTFGDRVWLDTDGDGTQDAGEDGIAGVTVVLLRPDGSLQAAVTTDANGNYEFDSLLHSLKPGEMYNVVVRQNQPPLDLLQGSPAGVGGAAADSNGVLNPTLGAMEFPYTIGDWGSNDPTVDFGFRYGFQIGDVLFEDANNNGAQDMGEARFDGVDLSLVAADGTVVGTTQTDANGVYNFNSLVFTDMEPNTNYNVVLSLNQTRPTESEPIFEGYRLSPFQQTGVGASLDSNGRLGPADTVEIPVTTPFYNGTDFTFDSGFVPEITIGDLLWHDLNGDGVYSADEPPLAGIEVQLRDADGNVLQTTTTDANGNYLFDKDLLANEPYVVAVELADLPDFEPTPGAPGIVYNRTTGFVLFPHTTGDYGTSDLTVDFPFVKQFNFGDFVWLDANNDGVQDAGETPVAGVDVVLYSGVIEIARVQTDANGEYLFNSLTHQLSRLTDYTIAVPLNQTYAGRPMIDVYEPTRDNVVPTGVTPSIADASDSDGTINAVRDASQHSMTSPNFNETVLTYDFGFVEQFNFGNFVWLDESGDGLQDPAELGIGGVVVELLDTTGIVVASTTTQPDGSYNFNSLRDDLEPNTSYKLSIEYDQVPLDGMKGTRTTVGSDPTIDSNAAEDITEQFVQFDIVSPNYGEVNDTLDFGFVNNLEIGDFVWLDENANGVQDAGEVPLSNVLVELRATDGTLVASKRTNATGYYLFTGADDNLDRLTDYSASIALNQPELEGLQPTDRLLGGNTMLDSNARAVASSSAVIDLTTPDYGFVDYTYDFGFKERIYIGDFVWADDGNGRQDSGEPGIANVTVLLFDSTGTQVGSTTTSPDGYYQFDSLSSPIVPGNNYTVAVPDQTALGARQPTTTDQGSDSTDNDGTYFPSTTSTRVTITAGDWGTNDTDVADFGFVEQFNIGDLVWLDGTTADGEQAGAPTELGIADVEVRLLSASGTEVATTTTDSDGLWSFNSLRNNLTPFTAYRISIATSQSALAALQPTQANAAGVNDTADSDAVLSADQSVASWGFSSPNWGDDDLSLDSGWVAKFQIGDFVWADDNGNGVQDAGEPGIADVTVRLVDVNGTVVATEVTDTQGRYSFGSMSDQLIPGRDYVLVIERTESSLSGRKETVSFRGGDAATDSNGVRPTQPVAGFNSTTDLIIAPVTAPAYGTDDLSLDFGFVQRLSIGDLVWLDLDRNGRVDTGEPGVGNATVVLRFPNETEISRTQTDAVGNYLFDSRDLPLTAGDNYLLDVAWDQEPLTVKTGFWIGNTYLATTPNAAGVNDTLDSDAVGILVGGRNVSRITATAGDWGSSDVTFDFGFQEPPLVGAELGNFLWIDRNGDGLQDLDEPALEGVVVQLRDPLSDSVIAQATTDANGQYIFNTLLDGFEPDQDYRITIDTTQDGLIGYVPTTPNANSNTRDESDSDGVIAGSQVFVDARAPIDGFADLTYDFGFQRLEIGDFVWIDTNNNGEQDANEAGRPAVTVELRNGAGDVVLDSTTTNDDGYYYFTSNENGLLPNTPYQVTVDRLQPALLGYNTTTTGSNLAGLTDSNGVETDGLGLVRATVTTGGPGSIDLSIDFGFYRLLEIGNYVWRDVDGDGEQDAGEPPLAGVTVVLYDATGTTAIANTTTDASGQYLFDAVNNSLQPNTPYVVAVPNAGLPADVTPTWSPSGLNDTVDSNGVIDRQRDWVATTVTTGVFGTVNPTLDFGFTGLLSIGDYVWIDSNGDGIQQSSTAEPVVASLVLELYDDNDVLIGTTETRSDGVYVFSNTHFPMLPDTNYRVVVPTLPASLELTLQAQGSNDAVDSNAAYVSGTATVENAATGPYGSDIPTYDIGLRQQSNIGDRVWRDENGNGVQDPGEPGIAGVEVQLVDSEGNVVATTTTDANGLWRFNSFDDGFEPLTEYTVLVPGGQAPLDGTQASPLGEGTAETDSNGTQDRGSGAITYTFTTGPPGTSDMSIDFGVFGSFAIGNYVFTDANFDGLQDATDVPLEGIVVRLYASGADLDSDAALATTATDSNGLYRFASTELPALLEPLTTYEVAIALGQSQLENYVVTKTDVGMDNALDNDAAAVGNFAVQSARTPDFGNEDMTFDFGFLAEAVIGDFVWNDVNGNGVQDDGENGIAGVEIQLRDANNDRIARTFTASDGSYKFTTTDGMVPGAMYTLRINYDEDELKNFAPTSRDAGMDDTKDSDGVIDYDNERVTYPFTAGPYGSVVPDYDFGFAQEVRIGDRVWLDANGNGLQDAGEDSISGVEVILQDSFGNELAKDRTGGDGLYSFRSTKDPLRPLQDYFVVLKASQPALVGLGPTQPLQGGSRGADSDGESFPLLDSIVASATAPAAGLSDRTFDFGLLPQLRIGSRVFRDEDNDGQRSGSEVGIPGVVITLVDTTTGQPVATTTSDSEGLWSFTTENSGLVPGSYVVRIDPEQQPNDVLDALSPSKPNVAGTLPNDDSDGVLNPTTGLVEIPVTIVDYASGGDTTLGFGFAPACHSIGGPAFIDADKNGSPATGELPIRGLTVDLLLGADDSLVDSTVADSTGQYEFGSAVALESNTEYVVRVRPSQAALTGLVAPDTIVDTATDEVRISVRTPAICSTTPIQAALPFQESSGITIGDYVFLDKNADGEQNAGDTPIAGITVVLYRPDGTKVSETTTDNQGKYQFTGADNNVQPNTAYIVSIDLEQPTAKNQALFPTFANEDGVPDGVDSDGEPRDIRDAASGALIRAVVVDVTTGAEGSRDPTIDFGLYNCVDTDVFSGLPEARVTFTGDAKRDFTSSNGAWLYFQDNPLLSQEFPDVGVPSLYPSGTISGWDMRGVYLAYSPSKDRLYVAFDCFGICGDADGNGNPGTILQGGAVDAPNLGESESFSLLMDTNNDGAFDIIVGVPSSGDCATVDCVGVYIYDNAENLSPGYRYSGTRLNYAVSFHCNPSMSCQDLEFTLDNWSKIPGLRTNPYEWRFGFEAFAGSFTDGGIGEDFMVAPQNIQARFICPSQLDVMFNPFPEPTPAPAPTPAAGRGNCCVADIRPGCNNPIIERCVCQRNSFCCSGVWDAACVAAVDQLNCGTCIQRTPAPTPVPTPQPPAVPGAACCSARAGAGCGNTAIEQCVCQEDSFCCSSRWDASCAAKVTSLRCNTVCGAFPAATPAPTPLVVGPAPTPAPPVDRTCDTCFSQGFGSPGSEQWCRCCGLDCGGFQSDCIRDNLFCSNPFRCSTSQWCNAVMPMTPPPTPAPPPPAFNCASCAVAFGIVGTERWCNCCANNCLGSRDACIAENDFCKRPDRCSATAACANVDIPTTMMMGGLTGGLSSTPAPMTATTLPVTDSNGLPGVPADACVPGSAGCVCDRQGACASDGFVCQFGRCVEPESPTPACTIGSAGCRCVEGGACGPNLECSTRDPTLESCLVTEQYLPERPTDTCGEFDGDNDGILDCQDPVIDFSDTGPTLVRIFREDDESVLVGTILVPTGGIVYKDGAVPRTIRAQHDADSESVDITTPLGRTGETFGGQAFQRRVRICLVPTDELETLPTAQMCLASRARRTDDWSCDDGNLLVTAQGDDKLLCGYTDHFTFFQLLDREYEERDPISTVAPIDNMDGSPAATDGLWIWLLIGLAALCCCCLLVLLICCIVSRSRRSRRQTDRERQTELKEREREAEPISSTPRRRRSKPKPLDSSSSSSSSSEGDDYLQVGAARRRSRVDNSTALAVSSNDLHRSGRRRGSVGGRRRSSADYRGLDEADDDNTPLRYPTSHELRRHRRGSGSSSSSRPASRRTSILDDSTYHTLMDVGNPREERSGSIIDAAIYSALKGNEDDYNGFGY